MTIKVYSLEDASGLEQALRGRRNPCPGDLAAGRDGLPGTPLHALDGASSRWRHPRRLARWAVPGGITIGVGSTQAVAQAHVPGIHAAVKSPPVNFANSTPNLNLDPAAFRPDQSVVLSGTPAPYNGDPEGGSIAKMGVAEGPVEPCEPVPALPSGFGAFGLSAGAGPATPRSATKPCAKPPSPPICARPPASPKHPTPRSKRRRRPGSSSTRRRRWSSCRAGCRKAMGRARRRTPGTSWRASSDPSARSALVPTLKEVWTAPDGKTHVRETLGRVDFFSAPTKGAGKTRARRPPGPSTPANMTCAATAPGAR